MRDQHAVDAKSTSRPHSAAWYVLAENRLLVQVVADALAWPVALTLGTFLRYEFDLGRQDLGDLFVMLALAMPVQLLVGWGLGLYRGRWSFGSFEEVVALLRAVTLTTLILVTLSVVGFDHLVPASAIVGGGLVALVVTGGTRYGWRLLLERQRCRV